MQIIIRTRKTQPGPIIGHYTVDGEPIPQSRPRFGNGHVYSDQHQEKQGVQIQLVHQHAGYQLFTGALKLDVTFFMPVRYKQRLKEGIATYHKVKPDLDNLIKFLLDCCNTILFKDDNQISIIFARKIYSALPRTEFTITKIGEHDETETV